MKILLLISSLVVIQAGVIDKGCDNGLLIEDICYVEEILKENLDRPYHLSVDYGTNTVYFSYSVDPEDDQFKTAKYNLNTKEYDEIEGLTNGFSQTVDLKTHELYIGTSDGIYKYDHTTNEVELHGEKGSNIWALYFKNNILYFSLFPSEFLYTLINGERTRFKDLEDTKVDGLVIDNENDIIFFNSTGLYSQRLGTKEAIYFPDSDNTRAVTTDIDGKAYMCRNNGIYYVNKENESLDLIVGLPDTFGVAFDNDNNIIYSDNNQLVRLKKQLKKA